jgi:CMP/dCMP kinase
MTKPSIIAIDGPAASGKTTLARKLAERLGYLYFDTGLMYRAVTLAALEQGMDMTSETDVSQLAQVIDIDVQRTGTPDHPITIVFMNGHNITARLRTAEVDANVSAVSAYRGVRESMTRQQRRIGERGHVVVVGRDIGTVVFPDADLKIYLDATVEERARRRWHDYQNDGSEHTYEQVLAAMRERDRKDSGRAVAPMLPAPDAVRIDTTDVEMQDLIDLVMGMVNALNGEETPAPEGTNGA